jgi:hypothetical protein
MPAENRKAIRNRRDGRAQTTRQSGSQVRTARTTNQALCAIGASASPRLPKTISGEVDHARKWSKYSVGHLSIASNKKPQRRFNSSGKLCRTAAIGWGFLRGPTGQSVVLLDRLIGRGEACQPPMQKDHGLPRIIIVPGLAPSPNLDNMLMCATSLSALGGWTAAMSTGVRKTELGP